MGLIIQYFDIQPFIVTLAGMFLARGLCYVISLDSIPITDAVLHGHGAGADPLPGGPLRLARRAHRARDRGHRRRFVLHHTRFGRTVYAIGGNEQSAMLMGLPVDGTKIAGLRAQRPLLGRRRHPVLLLQPLRLQPRGRRAWSSTPSPR